MHPQNDLQCVMWDVKLSLTHSLPSRSRSTFGGSKSYASVLVCLLKQKSVIGYLRILASLARSLGFLVIEYFGSCYLLCENDTFCRQDLDLCE